MASTLKLVALVGLLALCTYASADSKEETVTMGERRPGDKLLYSEKVDVPKTILRIHTRDVRYPPHADLVPGNITQIKVIDLLRTGKNAPVSFVQGGVGQKEAVIRLMSKRGGEIRRLVEIYGI